MRDLKRPDFLIIGAMKAGTTTVWADLACHPRIFFPVDKEPNSFVDPDVLSPSGRRRLATLYARAKDDQLCGDASTAYSKRPRHEGVAKRAREIMGPDAKIIYIVRNPIERIISQHHHSYATGYYGADINASVREDPCLIAFSQYAMQLEPWYESFGQEAVKVVKFEDYVKNRQAGANEFFTFLGVEPVTLDTSDQTFNRTEGKPVPRGWRAKLVESPLYRGTIRRMLSADMRQRLAGILLPKAPPRPDPPTLSTIDYIIEKVGPDVERLSMLLKKPAPLWDLQATRERFANNR